MEGFYSFHYNPCGCSSPCQCLLVVLTLHIYICTTFTRICLIFINICITFTRIYLILYKIECEILANLPFSVNWINIEILSPLINMLIFLSLFCHCCFNDGHLPPKRYLINWYFLNTNDYFQIIYWLTSN